MTNEQTSYFRILKSTSLLGGAQGITMLIGMVRVKCVALLIGPGGVGLVGMYQSAVQVIGAVAGLGLQASAVRDVAEAVSSEDQEHLGRIVLTLRRMCWLTGSIGSLLVGLFSRQLSLITFNNPDYAMNISLVGLTIFFGNVQGGQMALIQGMRQIGDLAKLNIFGTISGSIISVGLYWWLGTAGIVPAIVLLSVVQLIASWWFARTFEIPKVQLSWGKSFATAGGMVKLGLSLMWSGVLTMGVAYATRILIVREIDLAAVGVFAAAYAISAMVVDFVLGAMGADYYPSLTAVNHDHQKMRELVNQQTEIGLLLAIPGLLATLALAPWAIRIFYTADFWQATDLLRWFALGCLGRVVSWPLGFIILAKGAGRMFAFTETIANILHIGLIWAGLVLVGVKGASIAFFMLYVFYTLLMLIVSKMMIGFSWSRRVVMLLCAVFSVVTFAFCASIFLPEIPAMIVGLILTALAGIYCLRGLVHRVGVENRVCKLAMKIPLLNKFIEKTGEPASPGKE